MAQTPESSAEPATLNAKTDKVQEELNLTKYEPIYFIYGNPASKLQFSFKYELVNPINLYLGFTQLMFWELGRDSKPFGDINYNPQVFHRVPLEGYGIESVDFSPFEHKSNGRDGSASRSFERAYVQINYLKDYGSKTLRIASRVSYIYNTDKLNRDIPEYVGPLDLRFTITQFLPWILDKGEFYFRLIPGGRWAQNWQKGSQEAGVSFRLGEFHINPSIYIQFFNGYGESLLEYDKHDQQIRAGFML